MAKINNTTQREIDKITSRADRVTTTLTRTKNAFREQIFAIVKDRMPFQAKGHAMSNLAAMNALLGSDWMVSDIKEGAQKFIDQAEDTSSPSVRRMQEFQKLLNNPQQMQQFRDSCANEVFPDKEEVNEYLLLTAAYIDYHLDNYISAIGAIKKYHILEEKCRSWINNTSRKQSQTACQEAYENAVNLLGQTPTTLLTWLSKSIWYAFSTQRDGKLTEHWLNNFVKTLKKYVQREETIYRENKPSL